MSKKPIDTETLKKIGDAAADYYYRAKPLCTESLYHEWIFGLKPGIRETFENDGYEKAKLILPFLRYVMEKNDHGMDEFMRTKLSAEDYMYWLSLTN